MKHFTSLIVFVVFAGSAAADDANPPGLTLMERGALMFMEGILKEMEPAIDELSELTDQMGPALKSFAEEMGPKLTEMLAEVEDWSTYEAPEVLPNGDIIIRRKLPLSEVEPVLPQAPAPQVDL
jgi:hypothetical protein